MKILNWEKYLCLLGLVQLNKSYMDFQDILEKDALVITEEKDGGNLPFIGGVTSEILFGNKNIEEGLFELGFTVQQPRKFHKTHYEKKKENKVVKKEIIPEHEDVLENLMAREG